jgi:CubicO group peptidase (beta-lactamase class C family)
MPSPTPSPGTSLPAAPAAQVPPTLDREMVDRAVAGIDALAGQTMSRTGVPGMAVAVVYNDEVLHLKGYGVRKAGTADAVDPDTRFQLASVSKPVASTVVAGLVGDGLVTWDDPIRLHDPEFALADPWVTENVTVADLFSHRSGLPDHAGDLLEDMGYDRAYVLSHLRLMPLAPFRASYAYTNFGLTEAAVAVAKAAGQDWADLSQQRLYGPLGMTSTSSRFADFANAANAAATHVWRGDSWVAEFARDPDAQSPAGGVSSTIRDLVAWLRLQLTGGLLGGQRFVDEAALTQTHVPHTLNSPPRAPAGRSGFYGLGWDVSYDEYGRLRLGHSGAFALGAATNVTMLPGEGLGAIVLTNAAPVGAAEIVTATFFDVAQHGQPTVDWVPFISSVFAGIADEGRSPVDYTAPPSPAEGARPAEAYAGTYANDFYGPLTTGVRPGSGLSIGLGPAPTWYPLTHFNGDTFSYETAGENAVGRSGVTFVFDGDGVASAVTVENLDHNGLGTFRR